MLFPAFFFSVYTFSSLSEIDLVSQPTCGKADG